MIRIISVTGLIVDSETLLPLNEVEIYDNNRKLLGQTNTKGFFSVKVNVEKEGEIELNLLIKENGYDDFTQKEHWADSQESLNATYYFGLKKSNADSEAFSEVVFNKKYTTYDEVCEGFSEVKKEIDLDKKIYIAKKDNDMFFFTIDDNYYIVNEFGWIKINSDNDKIIINGDKIFSAKEINLHVKRSCVRGMSPIKSKKASFEVFVN